MRIKNEHGTGSEYIIHTPMPGATLIIGILVSLLFSGRGIRSRSFKGTGHEKTIRIYKDKMEVTNIRDKFVLYEFSDVAYIRKGVKLYLVPLCVALFFIAFAVLGKEIILAAPAPLFLILSFGPAIVIKPKKGMARRTGYSLFRDAETVKEIFNVLSLKTEKKFKKLLTILYNYAKLIHTAYYGRRVLSRQK